MVLVRFLTLFSFFASTAFAGEVPTLGTVAVHGNVFKNTWVENAFKSEALCSFSAQVKLFDLRSTSAFPYGPENFATCGQQNVDTPEFPLRIFFNSFVIKDGVGDFLQVMGSVSTTNSVVQAPVRAGAGTRNFNSQDLIVQIQPTVVNRCNTQGTCSPNLMNYYSAVLEFEWTQPDVH